MSTVPPDGYLGADARIRSGPADELVAAGYALETADAPLLHRGLTLADLAHVIALVEAGVLPPRAAGPLLDALLGFLDTPTEAFPYDPIYGDAYNSRERELERRLGDVAGWLHTGRTRREAGRIAFRLALWNRLADLEDAITGFADAVIASAEMHAATLWNDTTYLQPAQPSTFGHYLLTFAEGAVRDLERVAAARRWVDRSPAGVGGVSGTRVPLDRHRLAHLLGFSALGEHTRDVMWSTDGLVDATVAATQAATTADRLAEDLEIFTSPQFGYVTLDASVCRASVMLPQKRNPYALAVIRGGASTLVGRATGLLTTQRTPSARTDNWLYAYGEVTGSVELATRLVALARTVVNSLEVHSDRLASDAGREFTCATDLADELVLQTGIDYRSAYRIVGQAAARGYDAGRTAFDTSDLAAIAEEATNVGSRPVDTDHLTRAGDPFAIVTTRNQPGGSAPPVVIARCHALAATVTAAREQLGLERDRHDRAEQALIDAARTFRSP